MMNNFTIARLPQIVFGNGTIFQLPEKIKTYGYQILLVTGRSAFINTPIWEQLKQQFAEEGISYAHITVSSEPSPRVVDDFVQQYSNQKIDVVVAIGGGSVLDCAKAIAGLLPSGDSVMEYLEGVGKRKAFSGSTIPFIACPTTAGSGSEATKNAVLSERHADGFKKSFRHDNLIAQVAIVDPDLLASCPDRLLAGNGLDAFTQLLEAYVSIRANPMIDSLILPAINGFKDAIFPAMENRDPKALSALAYASLTSGIALAQTGLGVVHGLASPLGAYTVAPHGIVCGIMLAEGMNTNIQALKARDPESPALARYAKIGAVISNQNENLAQDNLLDALIFTLKNWEKRLNLPTLSDYDITEADLDKIVANCRGGSMQTNPILLGDDEIKQLLLTKL